MIGHRPVRSTRRLGRDGERGATMLEFALVLPLLALLAFGVAEMGLAWTAHNRIEGAVSTAARVGSAAGATDAADVTTLLALKAALPADALANADRVVIFRPSDVNGGVPVGCIKPAGSTNQTGVNSGTGRCNTYTGATLRAITPGSSLGTADDFWLPTSRRDSLAGPPDSFGVWVRTTHKSVTGTFFDDFTITRQSIYRLQPDIDG
ncbi:MAG: TadE/TadG family type IV pilus assembly protein [Acidimicrobiales bacterium]